MTVEFFDAMIEKLLLSSSMSKFFLWLGASISRPKVGTFKFPSSRGLLPKRFE